MEATGDGVFATLYRTVLTDARGKVWEYRFDAWRNLWRTIDPLGHQRRCYWSDKQVLLFQSEGYPPALSYDHLGPRDNPNNRYRRFVTDETANVIQSVDATGLLTSYTYDDKQRLLCQYPGQAHLGVQGSWVGQYGADGYVLCAFEDSDSDVENLPDYVSEILAGDSDGEHLFARENRNNVYYLRDPRAMTASLPGDSDLEILKRGVGFWTQTETDSMFCCRIVLSEEKAFNLSLYTHSADQSVWSGPGYPYTGGGKDSCKNYT